MDIAGDSKRRWVAYVERMRSSKGHVYLMVKVPMAVADAVIRDADERGQHGMRYYADAFAGGLSQALTGAETKHLL